jgi:ankyrin repeat protein
MFAVINLHAATVQTLLRFGADVNVQAASGFTPLMLAAGSGDLGITRALLNSGANPGTICRPGRTALVVAIERGYTAIVEAIKRALAPATHSKPQSVPTMQSAARAGALVVRK